MTASGLPSARTTRQGKPRSSLAMVTLRRPSGPLASSSSTISERSPAASWPYPVTTNLSGTYLGKAFVVCVIGGLGSVPGALAGGIVLGVVESFAGQFFGPQHALTVGFLLMLILLVVKPTGLTGIKGYE